MAQVFGFRLPDDLRGHVQKQAKLKRMSMSHYIIMLIDKDKKQKEVAKDGENKESGI